VIVILIILSLHIMLKEYFNPISDRAILSLQAEGSIAKQIKINTGHLPDLDDAQIALIGIGNNANAIRKALYQLSDNAGAVRIVDLGNLKAADDENNMGYGIMQVMEILLQFKIIPIIMSDKYDYSYYQHLAYQNYSSKLLEIVRVEPSINLEIGSTLRNIILHKPNYLFNVTSIGVQAHYLSNMIETYMNEMCFDVIRLGMYRDAPAEVEPIFRSANLISFDMKSIKGAEMNWLHDLPNGFTSDEACRIARYGGISNEVSSFLIFGLNFNDNEAASNLGAQLIWYFLQGFMNRRYDSPDAESKNFSIYHTPIMNGKHTLTFLKSHFSERWWLEIDGQKNDKNYISCSHADYLKACQDELPDRWWKAYQKLM